MVLPWLDRITEAWKSHIEFAKTLNGLSITDTMSTQLSAVNFLSMEKADFISVKENYV